MLYPTRLEVALDDAIELTEAAPPLRGLNIAVETASGEVRSPVLPASDGR